MFNWNSAPIGVKVKFQSVPYNSQRIILPTKLGMPSIVSDDWDGNVSYGMQVLSTISNICEKSGSEEHTEIHTRTTNKHTHTCRHSNHLISTWSFHVWMFCVIRSSNRGSSFTRIRIHSEDDGIGYKQKTRASLDKFSIYV